MRAVGNKTASARRPGRLFRLQSGGIRALSGALPTGFSLTVRKAATNRLAFYDTFDFRLFDAGFALEGRNGRLLLRRVDDEESIVDVEAPANLEGTLPWDLPPQLRARVEKTLSLRALGCVGSATVSVRQGVLIDDNQKTIARVEVEELSPADGTRPLPRLVRIDPLRGYEEDVTELFAGLAGVMSPVPPGSVVAEVAAAHGRGPEEYVLRPRIDLHGRDPAGFSIATVLSAHLALMEANEEGIRRDIDTEFLHDFRVALRRMRSVLSEFRKILDPESYARASEILKGISSRTGSLRDMDVLLLAKGSYLARVPTALRKGMELYFRRVEEERKAAFEALRLYLEGETYQTHKDGLASCTRSIRNHDGSTTTKEAADRALKRRMRRILRDLTVLKTSDISDQARHDVRIQCKKLRYLFETISPLYPVKSVRRAVKQLKRFQDALGRLQDVAVQQEALLAVVHGDETTHPRVAAAIGALVSSLAGESSSSAGELAALVDQYESQLEQTRRDLLP